MGTPLQGIGGLLRQRRRDAGITQRELAQRAGVSIRTLRDVERDRVRRPGSRSVRRLADALEISGAERDALLGGTRAGGAAPPELHIDVLGGLSVRRGDIPVEVRSPTQRCLLGLLALRIGETVPRSEIVDVLWDERPPRTCLALVHTHVARLRELIEPGPRGRRPASVVVRTPGGYRLEAAATHLDLVRFDDLDTRARAARAVGDRQTARDLFAAALRCWRGPVLSDVGTRLSRHPAAVAANQRRIDTAMAYADACLELGDPEDVVARLQGLVAEEPLHEALHARLMLALAGTGDHAAALALFARIRARLADELGVEPGPEIRAVHLRILRRDGSVPAQLPSGVPSFVGRASHLRHLDSLLAEAGSGEARSGEAAVVITSIAGTAGVGKTALALHWAHRVRDRFPDGQLYVNLRGFDPAGPPMTPAEALRVLLDAFAVPPERIPVSVDAQAALYRSLLAGRRVLVVLDNAGSADQVRPLLPGTPGCVAVVTSRNQLTRLVAGGARPVTVDLLTRAEAVRLLADRIGARRVAAEPDAVDEIVASCARLPLALALVAARAAAHPGFPIAVFARELRADRGRLDAFGGEDGGSDVRTAFSWSYHALRDDAARLFRLLGLHPGPDITAPAAASLAAVPVHEARALLGALARAHLIAEHAPGRYLLHDLLRAYAAELVRALEPEAERRAGVHRMLDHYLHSAFAGAVLLDPHRDPIALAQPRSGVAAEEIADRKEALVWFTTERPALLAAVRAAGGEAGFDRHVWQLVWTLATFLELQGHWHDQVAAQRAALRATQRLADRRAQANVHRGVALASARIGLAEDALVDLERAAELFDGLADVTGQAHTHFDLHQVYELQGRYGPALEHAERALRLYRVACHRPGQARSLSAIAWSHTLLDDHDSAVAQGEEALALLRSLDDKYGESYTLDTLGYALQRLGRHQEAIRYYLRSLALSREIGERYAEAATLDHLGDVHHALGRAGKARGSWRQALTILDQLGHAEADRVRAKLAGPPPGR